MPNFHRFAVRTVLLAGAALVPSLCPAAALAQTVPGDQPTAQAGTPDPAVDTAAAQPVPTADDDLQDIV